MTTFIILAAVMAALAIALVAWPLFKARGEGRGATGTLVVVALAIPLVAFILYGRWSNWDWSGAAQEQAGTHSMDQAVAMLEARLAANKDDAEGWTLLGRTHMVMGAFAKAEKAYAEAYRITGGRDADATANYAEALAMADETAMRGRAGELFEAALAVDPTNQKALWYGGLAALGAGNVQAARDRWAALAQQNPPAEVKAILDERVAELDRQLGVAPAASGGPGAAGATLPAATPAAAPAAAAAPAGSITVKVTLAPALAAKVPANAPLFVLARDPAQPGPPLAAKRLGAVMPPLEVVLTTADAMSEGRTIAGAKQLTIVARYSSTGMPMASSGDLYGEARYDAGQGKPVELVIDRTVP